MATYELKEQLNIKIMSFEMTVLNTTLNCSVASKNWKPEKADRPDERSTKPEGWPDQTAKWDYTKASCTYSELDSGKQQIESEALARNYWK